MKKIISILLLIMLAPMTILADVAGPKGLGYDAVVINKNGIEYTDYEGNEHAIPYNTKIHVISEDEYGGKTVYACDFNDTENCYDILKKDIAPLKEEVTPKDFSNNTDSESSLIEYDSKALVFKDGGVKLKKGPADAFGVYNTVIPKNTEVNITHCVDRGKGGFGYCYVDSNNYKGWIDASYDSDVYTKRLSKIMFFLDTNIFADKKYSKKLFTIPAYTVVDEVYDGNDGIYVKYNGQAGFVDYSSHFANESKLGYVLTLKKTELKKNGKVLATIPAGEKLKIKYGNDDTIGDYPYHSTGSSYCVNDYKTCYYYVTYKNQEGLVSSKNVESLYYESKVIDKTFKYALKVYDFSNYDRKDNETDEAYYKRHETGTVIPANTKVTSYNQDYNRELIKYNNVIGWVILDDEGDTKVPDDSITESVVNENENNNVEENVIVPNDDNHEENNSSVYVPENNEERNPNSPVNKASDTLTYALIGAVLVCVTAVVTALIVNGKNKSNNANEKKEEPKVETEESKEEIKKENKETSTNVESEKKE